MTIDHHCRVLTFLVRDAAKGIVWVNATCTIVLCINQPLRQALHAVTLSAQSRLA